MKRPEDVTLSGEEGEGLLARLAANTLTAEDRQVLGKVLRFYFWLLLALREAKLSLKRLKAVVFGEKPNRPSPPRWVGRPAAGGSVEAHRRPAPHPEGTLPLPRRRPSRSQRRLGMDGRAPRCTAQPRQWRVGMRS